MAEYEVTGVRWQMGEELSMKQRTQMAEDFIRTLQEGTPMILTAEPDNPHDNEAIAVYMDYTHRVGYIKHECCREVKPMLNRDGQCDAVVSGNDGHVTFFVEIPDAPEVDVSPAMAARKLPDCPLPQGIGLAFSDEERALQVVAPRLVNLVVSADTANALLKMAEHYMPLSRLSLCREDDLWRDYVLKRLRKACRLKLPQEEKEQLSQLRDKLNKTVGDFHRAHEHLTQRLFDQQLESLRKQAEGKDGLFARYEKYKESQPNVVESLIRWFDEMPHVELCNYKEHGVLARRLSYAGVSRHELYEVYAAILLLDKYGADTPAPAISKPKAAKPKAKTDRKSGGKPMTLKYYKHGNNGMLMRQRRRVDILFRKFREWGWIGDQTAANDFDALFEGEPRHCNITWKANGTILTILLQALMKLHYIDKQPRQSPSSMVKEQFGLTPNFDKSRLVGEDTFRIRATAYLLDINNPLLQRKGGDDEEYDTADAALHAVLSGQLRSTKAI